MIKCVSRKCRQIIYDTTYNLKQLFNLIVTNSYIIIPVYRKKIFYFYVLRKLIKKTEYEGRYSFVIGDNLKDKNPYNYYYSKDGIIDYTEKELNLFEGILDVIVYGKDYKNAVSFFGKLSLNNQKILNKFEVINVYVDKDFYGDKYFDLIKLYYKGENIKKIYIEDIL